MQQIIEQLTKEIEELEKFLENYKEDPEDYIDYEPMDECAGEIFKPDEWTVEFFTTRINNLKAIKQRLENKDG